ncbi:MAG: hypothetical protein ACREBR_01360 [bacterium]
MLLYMHHVVKRLPSLVPWIVRNIPQKYSESEGGAKRDVRVVEVGGDKGRPKAKNPRASPPTIDLTRLEEAVAPSKEEVTSYKYAALKSKADGLEKLLDLKSRVANFTGYDHDPEMRKKIEKTIKDLEKGIMD